MARTILSPSSEAVPCTLELKPMWSYENRNGGVSQFFITNKISIDFFVFVFFWGWLDKFNQNQANHISRCLILSHWWWRSNNKFQDKEETLLFLKILWLDLQFIYTLERLHSAPMWNWKNLITSAYAFNTAKWGKVANSFSPLLSVLRFWSPFSFQEWAHTISS